MKVNEIIETLRGPRLDKAATRYATAHQNEWFNSEHVGDIEEYQIKKLNTIYSVWNNNDLVVTSSLTNNIVDHVWVNTKYRGQKMFSKLLWFYKTREGVSPLQLGKLHSPEMQEVVKGMNRFKKYWSNGKETRPFSVDDFYDNFHPTEWRLMLENNGDFSDWPRYFENKHFMMESYDWVDY